MSSFEIRVAGIKQQIQSETSDVGPDGMSPTETFNAIQRLVHELGHHSIRSSGTRN
jgi:polyphosphate kinase